MSTIDSGLRADVMRNRMEDKNTLQGAGYIYVGTGNSTTINGNAVYETTALPPGTDGYVLTANSSMALGIKYTPVVSGVKGDAETDYKIGQVNITPANIGAETSGAAANAVTAHNDSSSAHSSLFATKQNIYTAYNGTSGTVQLSGVSGYSVFSIYCGAVGGGLLNYSFVLISGGTVYSLSNIVCDDDGTMYRLRSTGTIYLQSSTDQGATWSNNTSTRLYIRRIA